MASVLVGGRRLDDLPVEVVPVVGEGIVLLFAIGSPLGETDEEDTQAVEQEQRDHEDRGRDRIDARHERGDDRDGDDDDPPVPGERPAADDPHAGERESPHGDLERDPDREQGEDREPVVVLRLEEDVEGLVVEVLEEPDRRWQHEEVGERDAGDEQEGHPEHERQRDLPLARRERGQDEGVHLVEEDRQRDDEREVEGDGERHHERLADARGDRPALRHGLGQGAGGGGEAGGGAGELLPVSRRADLPRPGHLPERLRRPVDAPPQPRLRRGDPGQPAALGRLLRRGRRRLERLVEDLEQPVVLPEAEAEGDGQRDRADDEPRPQLAEVVDDREPVLVADGPERGGHAPPYALAGRTAHIRGGRRLGRHRLGSRRRCVRRRRRRRLGTPERRRDILVVVPVVPVGDRVAELAHPPAELLAQAGQPLRAEDHQDHDEDQEDLHGADAAREHAPSVAAAAERRTPQAKRSTTPSATSSSAWRCRSPSAAGNSSFAAATIPSARSRAASRAPVAAIRSQTASASTGVRTVPRRSSPARPGSRSRARMKGSVTVPSRRSVPRAFPVRSGGPETSSTSSSIWKARPIRVPKPASAGSPREHAAAKRLAVLSSQRSRYSRSGSATSHAPARCASSPRASAMEAAESTETWSARPPSATSAKAREKTASPVAVARSRPTAATTVGTPRRSAAASRTSSCTSVAEWMSSTATAPRTRGSGSSGGSPAARNTSSGRRRLPPAAMVDPACGASPAPVPAATSPSRASTRAISPATCGPMASVTRATAAALNRAPRRRAGR